MNWVLFIVVCGLTLILGAILIPFRERKKGSFSEIRALRVRRCSTAEARDDQKRTNGSQIHVGPSKEPVKARSVGR